MDDLIFYETLKTSLISFLTRQGLVYTDNQVNKFLKDFLNKYLIWDNLKDDMYEEIWTYFE